MLSSRTVRQGVGRRFGVAAGIGVAAWAAAAHRAAASAVAAFVPGQILVMDSNASAGNGLLFSLNKSTGVATPVGNGFGAEPWGMVLQSPTSLFAADATEAQIDRLNLSTGNWSTLNTTPALAQYPAAAIVADSPTSVLLASGFGRIYRVNTVTGQESLYADYGTSLGTQDPWGMARLADGSLALSDLGNGDVVRVYPNGTSALVSSGGLLTSAWGITALDADDVLVGEESAYGKSGIVKVNLTTGAQSYLTSPTAFHQVNGMTLEANGDLLVADGETSVDGGIYEVNPATGAVSTVSINSGFANPTTILIVPPASVPEPAGAAVGCVGLAAGLGLRRRKIVIG